MSIIEPGDRDLSGLFEDKPKENKAPHIWVPGVDDLEAHTQKHYGNAKHERHPHGVVFVNGQEVGVTLQCPHCSMHFFSYQGSGHQRGFCMKHMAVLCGKPECLTTCTDAAGLEGRLSCREL